MIRPTPATSDVLCLGELVWDCYATGAFLGGAPFNVAVQLARHGAGATLLTAVGEDDLGRRAQDFLREEGLPPVLAHPRLPTGTVSVRLDGAGIPGFTIHGGCAWTDLEGARQGVPGPGRPKVLVFGGLAMHAEANRHLLAALLDGWRAGPRGAPILICDLNLRPGWSDPAVVRWCLARCDYLKQNEAEARFLAALEGVDGPALLARHGLRGLCTTLGPAGLVWHGPHRAALALPVLTAAEGAPPVLDTVGAGDALTAAMAAGLAAGEAPEAFLERGRRWAAATCGVRGALGPR
jgi:fructokinase